MRIRNQGTAEPATTRKTPPTRKSAAKNSSGCTDAAAESTALKTAGTKQASAAKAKQMEKNEISTVIIDGSDSNLERSAVEEVKSSPEATRLTPESKATPGTKLVSKRTPGRPKRAVSAKGKAVSVVNSEGTASEKVLESPNKVEMEHQKVKEREKIEETGKSKLEEEVPCDGNIEEYVAKEDSLLVSGTDRKIVDLNVKEGRKGKLSGEDVQMEQDRYGSFDDEFEYGDRVDFGDHDDEVLADDDVDDPIEETEALEEECKELTAIAKEHKIKKECEIFVGGLDRDAVEEDLRQVFEKIGEVVEVRLHKNPITNKNKGYAFVKFSNKEHAKHALLEMKNPVICGKRCGTAPSEDNDTLFLGNICNTWTKEAIKQNLKEYGIEGVENITLVPDVQHEGLSRGFAFLEFSCHADAMLAYKRLQKPDVVFGHPERTAKVAFAEPLREPDPEIMAKTKVRARLSNPMPKTQAIKGGMSGGFRIGSGGNGTFSRFGRTFGQVGHRFNSKGFQHGRYYHQNEHGRTSTNEHDFHNRNSEFHRQQVMGGRRGSYGDDYRTSSRAASFVSPSRYNLSRSWYDGPERAWREHAPLRRQPFSPQRAFDQPYGGQQYDDPYYYDESAHSMKRPFYMTDHDPEYMEPPRFRPRMDHPYPEVTFHETRHRDPHHAAGSGLYSHDYFGSDYDAYPPYYRDHSYGGSY
ncbi:hypothetical protein V6Z11_D11G197800 [Gossypium hirsutum]|uniref:Nuclear localization sequence-binding protein isoform X2 n=1 Tax=Gossypium hirsutum TaxID=3635 RepID=A0ABM3B5S5_GOSHI|nr:nuclear localization sequence-binding protein isoform X2 [Gossypium hirsutum]XP_040962402.1 nuclear localization sequence-binding protein isoform X2 [Gossypium hirsutum]